LLVTGVSSGIGYASYKRLIQEINCYVYMGLRNLERCQKSIQEMPDDCNGRWEPLLFDESDYTTVENDDLELLDKLS
jgi:NADP-dependent 3-hydroxy acid dehydrogenase YdfG